MALQTLTLSDSATGNSAKILVELGFNCYSFQVMHRGETVETLWAHPNFTSGGEQPSHSGIPLLFPFAGRIQGTTLRYDGSEYLLEEGDGQGNAVHGLVIDRPWRVIEQSAARAVGQFQASVDDPSLIERWPADFCITVGYALRDGALVQEVRIDNPGERPLPFWLGTHPYFRLPLGAAGNPGDCVVTVPAERHWELVDLMPTGKLRSAAELPDLAAGAPCGDCHLDNVLTDLEYAGGRCTTRVHDPGNGRTLTQTFDESFAHCVVYTPPHRRAVCIEPYTAVPDAIRLESAGIATGLRRLAPGETYETTIEIRLE